MQPRAHTPSLLWAFLSALCLILSVFSPTKSSAVLINWGNAVDDVLMDSGLISVPTSPTALDGTYTMAIGYFTDPFMPTTGNLSSWGSNFNVFDSTATTPGGFNPTDGYFTGSANLDGSQLSDSPDANPVTTFPTTEQAYVWVYNSLSIPDTTVDGQGVPAQKSEWALYTNTAWTFPIGTETHGAPLEWRLSDAGTTAVLGSVNATFDLQTEAVFNVIPEPSATLLALLGWLGLVCRRRR